MKVTRRGLFFFYFFVTSAILEWKKATLVGRVGQFHKLSIFSEMLPGKPWLLRKYFVTFHVPFAMQCDGHGH